MDKRHFTIVEKNGKEHWLYVSSTPSSSAKNNIFSIIFLIGINNNLHTILFIYNE